MVAQGRREPLLTYMTAQKETLKKKGKGKKALEELQE